LCIICVLSNAALTGPPANTPRTFLSGERAATQRDDAAASPGIVKKEERWSKVLIVDPVTRDATRRALDDAARWLSASQCARLFSEFQDVDGQPLGARLRQLQSTPTDYLHLVYFHDGEVNPACKRHGTLAFTQVGSRVVYVCGRDFARAWKKEPREAAATLIHEMLHSLGLAENPPTPREITYRVLKLCWQ
jgi:hypothetical protein